MARRIRITMGDQVVIAELKESECPKTAEAAWGALPVAFPYLRHALFSGEEAVIPVRQLVGLEPENARFDVEPGDIGYFLPSPCINFYYGRVNVISPGNVFARVIENWEGLYTMCKQSWYDDTIPVRVERLVG